MRFNMKHLRLVEAALAVFFIASSAHAQNSGAVTAHAFPIGKGAGVQGYTSLLCPSGQFPMGQTSADPQCVAISGDATITSAGVLTIGGNKITLAKMATLAADNLIGNPSGSTATPAAVPLVNCANALIYSTSTHLFSCNTSAGTGTVTSVATAGLASGGTITSTGTVTVTAASKSDQQTGTSTTVAVTPSQAQSHDSAAKAWATVATCTTATCTVNANYNVSGVARSATGTYTVSFSTSFASTSYACHISSSIFLTALGTKATGSIGLTTAVVSGGSAVLTDSAFDIVCFGRQ